MKTPKLEKKEFTYGEIVAVGRRLRRYKNLYNNFCQFAEQVEDEYGGTFSENLNVINIGMLKMIRRYSSIYNKMLETLR